MGSQILLLIVLLCIHQPKIELTFNHAKKQKQTNKQKQPLTLKLNSPRIYLKIYKYTYKQSKDVGYLKTILLTSNLFAS